MTGERNGEMRGIIPRAVEQIISHVMSMREDGWDVTVAVNIVELYNEELRDLLVSPSAMTVTTSTSSSTTSASGNSGDKSRLKILNAQGRVTVQGLTTVDFNTTDIYLGMRQLDGLLDQATKARTTACTGMNERSSRSHVLFMLEITGRHAQSNTVIQGGLRLCDLAGSERLDRTGTLNDATRLKETVNINKSLSCLSEVFLSLSNKAAHIPYRNSKLTMLLQVSRNA
jgi:kinesin family member C1